MKNLYWFIFFLLIVSMAACGPQTSERSCKLSGDCFHFTVTVDVRGVRDKFQYILSQMTQKIKDEGAFHITPGDMDPPSDNYLDLTNEFGSDVVWFPVVGNHETESVEDMQWLKSHYQQLPWIVNPGPQGGETTSYSFDYENAHFTVLNQYFDGVSEVGTDGDVADDLYNWLAADLANTPKSVKFVFGHEPAFPLNRHVGDSLGKYPQNRDRFWNLLEEERVAAYFCGHTHYYSAYRKEDSLVWQIDAGNAGVNVFGLAGEEIHTFLDVLVGSTAIEIVAWRGDLENPFSDEEVTRIDF